MSKPPERVIPPGKKPEKPVEFSSTPEVPLNRKSVAKASTEGFTTKPELRPGKVSI